MKNVLVALLALAVTLPLIAQSADLRFIPPAPDSRTAVTVRIGGMWPDSGYPRCAQWMREGSAIIIVAGCRANVVMPAFVPWSLDVFLGLLEPGSYEVVVRRDSAAGIELGRATLLVRDAPSAFRLVPNVGIVGELVRIVAPASFVCNDTAACAPPVVRFGGAEAQIIRIDENELVVRAPVHGEGSTVDVTVEYGGRVVRVEQAFHYPRFSGDADPSFLEPVLVPIFSSGPGAHGSLWESELSVHNENDFPITSVPPTFNNACFPICDPRMQGRSTQIFKGQPGGPGWFVVHLPRQYAGDVHFGLLVRDRSRQAEALGVEVPVVREHEFTKRLSGY